MRPPQLFSPPGSCSCAPLNFSLAWLGATSGIQIPRFLGTEGMAKTGRETLGGGRRGRVNLGRSPFKTDLVLTCSCVKLGDRAPYPTHWSSGVVCTYM